MKSSHIKRCNPQLAGIVHFRLDLFVAFTVLLNPTLGRDASHMLLRGFHSLSPQLAGIVRFRLDLFVAFTVLLNPTSGRDASHMLLISLRPRHMCTSGTHVSWSGTHVSWSQAYKQHVGGISPRCGIEQNCEGHEQIEPKAECSSGTHVSWSQAYKQHGGGVSPQCGIEQNCEGHKQIEPKADNTC